MSEENKALKSAIEELKCIAEGCVPPELAIEEAEALLGFIEKQQKEKEKNVKAIEMLQKHIKHCEQEAKGSLNNEICHIALKFDKHLLQELLEE